MIVQLDRERALRLLFVDVSFLPTMRTQCAAELTTGRDALCFVQHP